MARLLRRRSNRGRLPEAAARLPPLPLASGPAQADGCQCCFHGPDFSGIFFSSSSSIGCIWRDLLSLAACTLPFVIPSFFISLAMGSLIRMGFFFFGGAFDS